jgi:predicted DNA-binding transcriptional regulator YafY
MRRADRLFQIIQILRRSSRPITGEAIAQELEVSKRTVYRDIADLVGQRVPIQGEAGFGYVLARDYDMPPLMLTPDELEAVVLGAQWVAERSDAALANAARDVVAKISAAVPTRLLPFISEPSVGAKPRDPQPPPRIDLSGLRRAIREGNKVRLRYRDETGKRTTRTTWPVLLGYSETTNFLVAWCELRQSFRHFKTERILHLEFLDEPYQLERRELRRQFEAWRENERAKRRDR